MPWLYESDDEPLEKVGEAIGSLFAAGIYAGVIAIAVSYAL